MRAELILAARGAGIAISFGAMAADETCRPIAVVDIDRQWQRYSALPGARGNRDDAQYQCIYVESTKESVCRTKSANPAHPSIIARMIVQSPEGLRVATTADTAASCPAFLAMMAQYRELDRQMIEALRKSNPSGR